jgi:hypothetical protein
MKHLGNNAFDNFAKKHDCRTIKIPKRMGMMLLPTKKEF